MRTSRWLTAALILAAAPLAAQEPAAGPPAVRATPTGPAAMVYPPAGGSLTRWARPATEVDRGEAARRTAAARTGERESRALMIVGAAGILAGLLFEEDVLVLAGAGVGGVGLYFHLR